MAKEDRPQQLLRSWHLNVSRSDGKLRYTQAFANDFARVLLSCKGKKDTTWLRLQEQWVARRNTEAFLFHPNGQTCRTVYKDILMSPRWDVVLAGLTKQCLELGEYRVLTVDVTYKTAKKAISGTVPDHQGILTVCGASRTLLAAAACLGEGPDEIIAQLTTLIPATARGQVEFVCLDRFDAPESEQSLIRLFQ